MFHLYPPSKKQIQEVAASIAAASASMNTHEIARALFDGRIGTHHEKFRLGQDTDAVGRRTLQARVEGLEGLAAEALDCLEYVRSVEPCFVGWGVRALVIQKLREALPTTPAQAAAPEGSAAEAPPAPPPEAKPCSNWIWPGVWRVGLFVGSEAAFCTADGRPVSLLRSDFSGDRKIVGTIGERGQRDELLEIWDADGTPASGRLGHRLVVAKGPNWRCASDDEVGGFVIRVMGDAFNAKGRTYELAVRVLARLERAEILLGEAYQVVAELAERWPSDDAEITRALDILSRPFATAQSMLPVAGA
jgi:hypothetical protein